MQPKVSYICLLLCLVLVAMARRPGKFTQADIEITLKNRGLVDDGSTLVSFTQKHRQFTLVYQNEQAQQTFVMQVKKGKLELVSEKTVPVKSNPDGKKNSVGDQAAD